MKKYISLMVLIIVVLVSCQKMEQNVNTNVNLVHIKNQLDKFVPVSIDFDRSILPQNEMQALKKIVQAAQYMDVVFMDQAYSNNKKIEQSLSKNLTNENKIIYDYFKINFGPFDRLDHDRPFWGKKEKPAGANYYPENMTKDEFRKWLEKNPDDKENFESEFTIIRRKDGGLTAIPYSEAYKEYLKPCGDLLKEAAQLTSNETLKKYLETRAEAFLTNDYFESDMNWVDMKDHLIEVVIGPYEVYEDNLFGYKAAFEAFVTIVDPVETKKLKTVAKYLNDMEAHLPIPQKYMNFNRGSKSPIMVVQEVYAGGDNKSGVQTAAFNLPNDERVREAKGSKKVMLKNIIKAKFDNILKPIVKELLEEKDLAKVAFEPFFNHILMHEMSHGIGPGKIIKNGVSTNVNRELKNLYSTIEEAKADILGVRNLQLMIDKKVFDKKMEKNLYSSFLGGIFRSVRFGINEAHGGANIISFNYLIEKGGFEFNKKELRFRVNDAKIKDAITDLAHEILMIEALGDYDKAQEFVKKYRYMPNSLKKALEKVTNVPVDIKPEYTIEKEI